MTLELTLLISLVGLVIMSAFTGSDGPARIFSDDGGKLGARIERKMTTGRCFQTPKTGAAAVCDNFLWESATPN